MPRGQSTSGSKRGFAAMDPKQQKAIASKGGKAAHEKGAAHEFKGEQAIAAGRKGGQARSQAKPEVGGKGGRK